MSDKRREGVRTLAEAFEALPESKKEFLLGYAEGVIAARKPEQTPASAEKTSA